MQYSSQPGKFPLAFAGTGNKRTVPENSLIGTNPGYASLADGFPPLCATPLVAGGIPPDILDINGILNQTTAVSRWSNAGGGYTYDSTFANDTNVTGYPQGARILRADGNGYWFNTSDNNVSNPDSGSALNGWVPDLVYGQQTIPLTNSNVTLTNVQAGFPIIVFTGTLTANVVVNFPKWVKQWLVVNNCIGSFNVVCQTSTGLGVYSYPGTTLNISGDGTNINSQFGRAALGASGTQILPSGLIIQWGNAQSNATPFATTAVTFQNSFPNACLSLTIGVFSSAVTTIEAHFSTRTQTGFNLICNQASTNTNYLAIGY